jgi:hypothetical protein
MHLEAMIVQTWRPYSWKFGDTLEGCDCVSLSNRASLEMHLEAMIVQTCRP